MDDLLANIKKRASVWASKISRTANAAFGKPKHIKVKSHVVEGDGKVGIESTALSLKGDARAYEYGSGIHSTSKRRSKRQQADGTILIAPKTKQVLAFFWEKLATDPAGTVYRGKKLIKKSPTTGKALFRFVEHPGVAPAGGGKGYLRPAIAAVRKDIRKELTKDVRDAYISGIRKAFGKK